MTKKVVFLNFEKTVDFFFIDLSKAFFKTIERLSNLWLVVGLVLFCMGMALVGELSKQIGLDMSKGAEKIDEMLLKAQKVLDDIINKLAKIKDFADKLLKKKVGNSKKHLFEIPQGITYFADLGKSIKRGENLIQAIGNFIPLFKPTICKVIKYYTVIPLTDWTLVWMLVTLFPGMCPSKFAIYNFLFVSLPSIGDFLKFKGLILIGLFYFGEPLLMWLVFLVINLIQAIFLGSIRITIKLKKRYMF